MPVFGNILAGASGQGGGYTIDQSIRFNDNDSAYLYRTFGTPTDRNKWSYSLWMKPTTVTGGYVLETNVTGGVTFSGLVFGNNMAFYDYSGGSAQIDIRTAFTSGAFFRDPSSWYHVLFVYDSDQATNTERVRFYINGTRFPSSSLVGAGGGAPTWPAQFADSDFNANGIVHRISSTVNGLVDGYMAEIHFIDGQALDPTSFGETNSTTGQWVPIAYSGSYGTNGFYITGENSAALGTDYSGNGNNFTSSGLTSADQVTDTPTDNYATLNPLLKHSSVTLADGNLEASTGTTGWFGSVGTIGIQLGDKVYFEGKCLTNTRLYFGLSRINGTGGSINPLSSSTFEGNRSDTDYMWRVTDANTVYYQTTNQSVTVSAVAVNDIVGCSVDTDGTVKFYKNGTEIHSFSTTLVAGNTYMPVYSVNGATSTEKWEVRFGSTGISHQPTGFNLLRTSDMDDPTIADPTAYFDTLIYSGDGTASRSITGLNFDPNFVWLKRRDSAEQHLLFDSVRGDTLKISSNSTSTEFNASADFEGFTTGGFIVNAPASVYNTNDSGSTQVAWNWKANGTGSSNTDGTVTSTVSVDTTSGFSIAKWTHTTASNYTVGHGLGAVPKMILVKTTDQATNWDVYHSDITVGNRLLLNSTSAQIAGYWGANSWTSSTFSIGSARDTNGSTMVAYCFAEVEGFSKIGKYTGNGSADGPFVYCGFNPAFVLGKRTNGSTGYFDWWIFDDKRPAYNLTNGRLYPNLTAAEDTGAGNLDFVSNGFKIRSNTSSMNNSGDTFIFAAFAESPFKTANAR